MTFLLVALGVFLLVLLLWDVHQTVFVPRGPAGPLARRLYAWSWAAWFAVIGTGTANKRRRLAALGPLLIPLTVLMWAVLLLTGYTLIFLPYARAFELDGNAPFPAWFNALYISGYAITTLGVGDIVPTGMAMRLVMVSAGASGFLLITVAVTYLLSAYGALDRMTALAFEIHRFVGRRDGDHPVDLIVTAANTGSPDELSSWLSSTASALSEVVQTENEFPLLHYFHMPDERSLTLALADLLELVTLCRTTLDPERYPVVSRGIISAGTERIVRVYFATLTNKFGQHEVRDDELTAHREASFDEAYRRLVEGGVAVRPYPEARAAYDRAHRAWDKNAASLRLRFGYPVFDPWGEVPGGSDVPLD